MKKMISMLNATILALLTTSCLEQEVTLTLNKDGSGTITETYLMEPEVYTMVQNMNLAQEDENAPKKNPEESMIDAARSTSEKQCAMMGKGVSLKEVKALNKDGKKGVVVVYDFKDINTLKYSVSMDPGEEDEEPDHALKFTYTDGLLTIDNKGEKAEAEIDETSLAGSAEMSKGLLKGMRVKYSLKVPGGITKTNAKYVENNQITFQSFEFSELVTQKDQFKEYMKGEYQSPAAAHETYKGLDGTKGVKFEPADTITVKLK